MCTDSYHVVKGVVADGVGEGARYVKLYLEVITKTLRLKPYLGTLNIRIDHESLNVVKSLLYNPEVHYVIPPPMGGFGKVFALKAYVKRSGKCVEVYIIKPEKTVHGDEVIELISDRHLRSYLNVGTGDEVEVILVQDTRPPCNCRQIQ